MIISALPSNYLIPGGLCLFLLSSFIISIAQSLPVRRYTTRDGLVADRITVITQDKRGFMWIGSLFGLSKYDGTKFTTINLSENQRYKAITSLLAADDKLYAGFLFGGGLLEYEHGIQKQWQLPKKRGTSPDIAGIFKGNQGVLVTNFTNELFRFVNGKFTPLLSLDSTFQGFAINSVIEVGDIIWIGTNKGLEIFSKGRRVNRILEGRRIIFLQKREDEITVVSASDEETTIENIVIEGLSIIRRQELIQSPDLLSIPFHSWDENKLWTIDVKQGLMQINKNGQISFINSPINPQSEVRYIFADRENNLWIVTDPGVTKISNIPAVSFQFQELAAGGGFITEPLDSIFWAVNSKYLYYVSDRRITKVEEFRNKENWDYLGLVINDAQKNLWVSTWNKGVWKLNYKSDRLLSKSYIKTFRGKDVKISCFVNDRMDNLWGAGSNGIFQISDGKIIDHVSFILEDSTGLFITAMTIDEKRNIIWLGDNSRGLYQVRYKSSGDTFNYELVKSFGRAEGLSDTYIRSLFIDSKGTLWIGTRLGGIYQMNTEQAGTYRFYHASNSAGMHCTRVTDINQKDESLWFATCDGVLTYSLVTGEWKKFGVSDGLLGGEVFSLTIHPDKDELWAVSAEGISNLRYRESKLKIPPLINLTRISILDNVDSSLLFKSGEKRLSANEHSIEFEFAAASYTDEKKVRYKYMLDGRDKDWSLPVQTNSVNYLSLPFGHYTFRVLAWNGDSWSVTPATFSFHIIRPFYKSFWFAALLTLFCLVTFYLIRLYRLKQKLKVERLRVNIARDLHDDIGSALGSINLMSENANRRLASNKSVDEVSGVFQKIGYSAQTVLDAMDDIIWAINPEKDNLDDLMIRMREFAIPLLEAKDIQFDLQMNAVEGVKPSMEIKRNIYLIFKEAIFNVVRHSSCSKVYVRVMFAPKSFDILVSDNGKGFNENHLNNRNGLRNMRKRASLSNAELIITSESGTGTSIRFHGPFR